MNDTLNRLRCFVEAATCADVAETISPPHVSSTVTSKSELLSEVAHELRFCQATHFRNLQINPPRAAFANGAQRCHITHDLVVDHRQGRMLPNLYTFLHRRARLFEIETREICHRT